MLRPPKLAWHARGSEGGRARRSSRCNVRGSEGGPHEGRVMGLAPMANEAQVENEPAGICRKVCSVIRTGMRPGYLTTVIRRNTVDLMMSEAADLRPAIGNSGVLALYLDRNPRL